MNKRLQEILLQDEWLIDGNYGGTLALRLQACDTVFFLDYPMEVCIEGVQARKGKARTDMPWIEQAHEEDEAFMDFIRTYNTVSRPVIMELLNKHKDKNVWRFVCREEAQQYLDTLRGTGH